MIEISATTEIIVYDEGEDILNVLMRGPEAFGIPSVLSKISTPRNKPLLSYTTGGLMEAKAR